MEKLSDRHIKEALSDDEDLSDLFSTGSDSDNFVLSTTTSDSSDEEFVDLKRKTKSVPKCKKRLKIGCKTVASKDPEPTHLQVVIDINRPIQESGNDPDDPSEPLPDMDEEHEAIGNFNEQRKNQLVEAAQNILIRNDSTTDSLETVVVPDQHPGEPSDEYSNTEGTIAYDLEHELNRTQYPVTQGVGE
ncbi:uncharacterized protein LOC128984422 [Macrosteles quadrilineatus]|uniref:uncharacterized protein LOC128984422 n=1 Tax=Macrosteles quadrilineatus TaxID=74068 RepID=UPI0023E0D066|nr:uncharacterized protein LOC128984422 [Macrosteles quadrilineatus]